MKEEGKVRGRIFRLPFSSVFMVRLATLADIHTVLNLIQSYYAYDGIVFDESRIRAGLQELLGNPSLGRVWLIEQQGQDAGYAVLTFAFDLEFGGREAFVTDLYIAQDYRGRGLGRRTLEAIEGFCRAEGVKALELQVEQDNAQALGFYLKLGFKAHQRIPMSKRL